MPDIEVLIGKLDQFEKELIDAGKEIAEEMALNAKALIVARVQREGLPGAAYSTKLMLATQSMFSNKGNFKPTQVATRLGYNEDTNSIYRNKDGSVSKKKAKPVSLWIKFPKAKKAVPVMILEQGYKQLRDLDGRQSSFVDLTYTGRMFQNFNIQAVTFEGTKCIATLGGLDLETKKKLEGHAKKYGEGYLMPTEEEKRILDDIARNKVKELNERFQVFTT